MNNSDGPPVSGFEHKQPPVATSHCAEVSFINSRERVSLACKTLKGLTTKLKQGRRIILPSMFSLLEFPAFIALTVSEVFLLKRNYFLEL